MQRIDTATSVANKWGAGKNGFTDGDVVGAVPSTDLEAAWFDNVQEEVAAIIEAVGMALSGANKAQLLTALRSNGLIYGVDVGAVNAMVVTYTPALSALVDGMVLYAKAKYTNTGATTLNVGTGPLPVLGLAGSALQAGEIVANRVSEVVYNAALNGFVLMGCPGAPLQVAPGTQSQHAVQYDQVGVLTGAVVFYATPGVPTGWLKANGAAISRTTYARLYAAIGTTFGAGDGATTFNVPDPRGMFLRALDDGAGRDASAARTLGSVQDGTWLRTVMQEWTGNDGSVGQSYIFGQPHAGPDAVITNSGGPGGTVPNAALGAGGAGWQGAASDNFVSGMALTDSGVVNRWIRMRPLNLALPAFIKY
jgi:hypothetical protein